MLTQLSCLIVIRVRVVNYLPSAQCKVPNCFNLDAQIAIPFTARLFCCLTGVLRGLASGYL